MIEKFQKLGSLYVQSGRGRKPLLQDTTKKLATRLWRSTGNIAGKSSARCVDWNPYDLLHGMENLMKDYSLLLVHDQACAIVTSQPTWRTIAGRDGCLKLARWMIFGSWKIVHFYVNGCVDTQNCRIWDSNSSYALMIDFLLQFHSKNDHMSILNYEHYPPWSDR